MQVSTEEKKTFEDRRGSGAQSQDGQPRSERRQFSSSHNTGRPEVDELANAIDQYKLNHRRRFITFEELFDVMASLGYHK